MLAVEVTNLNKCFTGATKALDGVEFNIQQGEMVALIGASGSGKSTLLRHISGLVQADKESGTISVLGQVIQKEGRIARNARKSRARIGVVFQQFNLVKRLSVLTNVLTGLLGQVPLWRGTIGYFKDDEKRRALANLKRVGILDHATKRASDLSGGQQQRAAIARALTQGAEVVLADEPIASLDPSSSRKVMDCLQQINAEDGITVMVSLHQVDYALEYCPRTIAMRDGRVVFDGASAQLTPEFLKELYGEEVTELYADDKPAIKQDTVSEDDLVLVAS